jgi:scyllo-inositol 2-dehydrogenase (NADP+)
MAYEGHITYGIVLLLTIIELATRLARLEFPLRGAIVGYGLAGAVFHAPLIAATPGLEVATIVTRDPGRRDQALRENPGARVVPSADEVWERAGEYDFAVIAARNDAHVPLARRGLDAGLAVVVDKPLAPSADEAAALVEHARAAGKLLTVFQNRRWDSDQRTLRRLLSEGELGDVLRYESRFERWRPELREEAWRETAGSAEGGGVLLDLGSHLVDQALQLFGPATHVYGEVQSRRGAAGDDDAFVALCHRAGTYSHLRASALTAAPGPRLRVLGTRAAYVVPEVDGQEDALRAGRRPDDREKWGVEPEERWGRLVRGEEGEPVPSEPGAWPCFYAKVERALREGGAPPVDPDDAVTTLRVLEAARRSAIEQEVIALPD